MNFPMGNNFGKPFDPDQQTAILIRALQLIEETKVAGTLEDWPEEWHTPVEYFTGARGSSS